MGYDIGTVIRSLGDMVIPRVCVVCGEPLAMHERHICIECLSDMPYTRFCEREHNGMADKFNARIVAADEEGYCRAVALFYYNADSPYRHVTPHIKYGGGVDAGGFFGRMLGESISGCRFLEDVDCVVPVPLHWRRRMSRGYNQAELIASAVSRHLSVPMCPRLLKRVRHTRSQTMVPVAAKYDNVRGVFRVSSMPCRPPRHILLVDDVFTTGSTLAACHDALRLRYDSSTRISAATLAFVSGG